MLERKGAVYDEHLLITTVDEQHITRMIYTYGKSSGKINNDFMWCCNVNYLGYNTTSNFYFTDNQLAKVYIGPMGLRTGADRVYMDIEERLTKEFGEVSSSSISTLILYSSKSVWETEESTITLSMNGGVIDITYEKKS